MNDRRTALWFGAFTIVVILIGVAGGVLLDRFLLRWPAGRVEPAVGAGAAPLARMSPRGMRPGPPGPGGTPGAMRPHIEDRLTDQLGLTTAQKEQIGAILGRRRARLDEVRGEMQKRMEKEQEDLRAEIRGVLNESQKKKFDEVMATTPGLGGRGMGERGSRRGGMSERKGP